MLKVDISKYEQAASNIINMQKEIIGPLAVDMAKRVEGLKIDDNQNVSIFGDPKTTLHLLVKEYEVLFGFLSVKVSKDSIKSLGFSPEELPDILK